MVFGGTGHEAKPNRHEKRRIAKSILRFPDLEAAKSAILNSLSCPDAQRGYRHAIDEFLEGYCYEPRFSLSKTVVVRYRMHLESRKRTGRIHFEWVVGDTYKACAVDRAGQLCTDGPSLARNSRNPRKNSTTRSVNPEKQSSLAFNINAN